MRGTGKEKRGWIFVLQTSNKTECMCTNVMKCEKERGIFMWRHKFEYKFIVLANYEAKQKRKGGK
jgi:hypothetical protein